MINPKIIGMMLIVSAASSIGLVTIGFQSAMATELADREEIIMADVEEDVEAGNATTSMMTNQTADGNMTGSISDLGTGSHAEGEGTTPSDTCSHAEC